ncbi:MAG: Ig-like domain-containing protein [Gemmatimonadota bacterium]|nr:Ig-like domain-containing protein [Gemmatimonadota bacterium]
MPRHISALPLLTLALATACADPRVEPRELVPTRLEVSPDSVDFDALFATARLAATVFDQDGNVMAGAAVAWQSSSFEVARVDQSGLVTAVDNGSAYIVAAAGDATDSARVQVLQRPASVRIAPPRRPMLKALEDTVRVTASVFDPNGRPIADAVVSWSSGDTTIVTVRDNGLVTAVATGTAVIRATLGELADSVTAEVRQVPADVRIRPAELPTFESLGDTARLAAQVVDANGHPIPGLSVSWSTSNVAIASVDREGLVTSAGNGSATITATALSASGSIHVEVEQVPTSLEVSSPLDLVAVGDSLQMEAEAYDAGGSPIPASHFTWLSSDTAVATVTPVGRVHAVGPGTAEISATLHHLSASAPVTTMHRDEFALRALFQSANGPLWANSTNWTTDAPLSDWYGVELNERGRVRSLNLSENNLVGRLPPEIGKLTELEELHLTTNLIEGPLPPEIGRLKALREIHLEENLLEGPLPPEIGDLESLTVLGLFDNYLEGPIPREIGRLEQLEVLDLTYNSFTGSIPDEVIDLPYLWHLGLFGNELSGSIPPRIGDFQSLEVLDLCYNKLTGPIPPEIGRIETLRVLALCGVDYDPETGNRLSGPIPPEIGNLTNLRLLDLGANRLEGPVPPEIGRLENLDSLSLHSNLLTSLPPELGNLTKLEFLSLYGNRLTGMIPNEIGNLTKLLTLRLGRGRTSGDNILSGTIPSELGNLTRLHTLDLGANRLTGMIPGEFGRLDRLEFLELGTNELTGEIPPELGDASRLAWLNVCPNSLSGPIPGEIGRLRALRRLFLCSNNLTGDLPPELGNLTGLVALHLSANRLTGEFPTSMLKLRRLDLLFWRGNNGLCAPNNQAFREWLDSIANSSDIYCGDDSGSVQGAGTGTAAPTSCTVTVAAARPLGGRGWSGGTGATRGDPGWRAAESTRVGNGPPGTWTVPCGPSSSGSKEP